MWQSQLSTSTPYIWQRAPTLPISSQLRQHWQLVQTSQSRESASSLLSLSSVGSLVVQSSRMCSLFRVVLRPQHKKQLGNTQYRGSSLLSRIENMYYHIPWFVVSFFSDLLWITGSLCSKLDSYFTMALRLAVSADPLSSPSMSPTTFLKMAWAQSSTPMSIILLAISSHWSTARLTTLSTPKTMSSVSRSHAPCPQIFMICSMVSQWWGSMKDPISMSAPSSWHSRYRVCWYSLAMLPELYARMEWGRMGRDRMYRQQDVRYWLEFAVNIVDYPFSWCRSSYRILVCSLTMAVKSSLCPRALPTSTTQSTIQRTSSKTASSTKKSLLNSQPRPVLSTKALKMSNMPCTTPRYIYCCSCYSMESGLEGGTGTFLNSCHMTSRMCREGCMWRWAGCT